MSISGGASYWTAHLHTNEPVPLILFSGLAADASVFAPQKRAFPQLVVPRWPVPHRQDSLDSYCQRIANDWKSVGPCLIGGASFGGIVAVHVAQYLEPLAIVLIGSPRTPKELPFMVRNCRFLSPCARWIPVSVLKLMARPLGSGIGRRFAPNMAGLVDQFQRSDARVFKWSIEHLLQWKGAPMLDCPIYQIHGELDWVIPFRNVAAPDTVVRGGGHVITLTHPNEVNAFIRSVLEQVAGGP